MKIVFFVSCFLLGIKCFSIDIKTCSALAVALESGIDEKKWTKDWKKERKSWVGLSANCGDFESLTNWAKPFFTFVHDACAIELGTPNDLRGFCLLLQDFEETLSEKVLMVWSEESKNRWIKSVSEVMAQLTVEEKAAQHKVLEQKLTVFLTELDKELPALYQGALKGHFADFVVEKPENNKNGVAKPVFSDLAGNEVELGEGNFLHLYYKIDWLDVEFGEGAMLSVVEKMKLLLPDYKVGRSYNLAYHKAGTDLFEWNTQRFADIAKKPTFEVGVLKDSGIMVVKISEPVFRP